MQENSKTRLILLFWISSLAVLLIFIYLYQMGLPQIIQEMSRELIHRTLLSNVLLLICSVYGVLIRYGGMKAETLGLDPKKIHIAVKLAVIIWISVQMIQGLVGYTTNGRISIDPSWEKDSNSNIGILIGMLLGTAFYEEIGFRGFLLTQFIINNQERNRTHAIALALVESQILFTALHIPWKVMSLGWTKAIIPDLVFSVFMNGIIFGLLYLRTQNLFFVMFVHALGNAPTPLIEPSISPSSTILLLSIICYATWPFLVAHLTRQKIRKKESNLI